jgi:hypothetical protein
MRVAIQLPLATCFLSLAPTNSAWAKPTVSVEAITSQADCTSYASFWGAWAVTQCQDRFSSMRENIESALIETGAFDVLSGRGETSPLSDYIVYGTVTGLGAHYSRTTDTDFCVNRNKVKAAVDIRMIERSTGRVVFGGNVAKSLEQAAHIVAGERAGCSANRDRRPLYDLTQRELSLAVARSIAFKASTPRVRAIEGRRIVIDLGKPLLSLGMQVKVKGENGMPVRYRVISTMSDSAVAEPMQQAANVKLDSIVEVIEQGDVEENARRIDKVELP